MKKPIINEYNCVIHWSDGTKPTKAKMQQFHIDNLNEIPIVDHIVRGKKV